MLTIIYGDVENSIYNTNVYFKNTYEPEWLETELAKQQDVTINLRHMMSFGKDTKFEIKIKNGNEMVHSMRDLIPIASQYLNEMKQE